MGHKQYTSLNNYSWCHLLVSPDYRWSRMTSPLLLTDITSDYFTLHSAHSLPSQHFPSLHDETLRQCIISPIIQFNDSVKYILATEELRMIPSLWKAPQVGWVTTKSGVCLEPSDVGRFWRAEFCPIQSDYPQIKTEIPASKESSEAAVPCVQGRIFAGVDKKGDMGSIVINLDIKYLW